MPSVHPVGNEHWIPNIILGKDYDRRYLDDRIHYDELNNLADFFGRDMPVHRHAQYLQIHFVSGGKTHFHIDQSIYHTEGPACFLTPATVPHSFNTQQSSTGHVITIHESLLWQLMRDGLQEEMKGRSIRPLCVQQSALPESLHQQWQSLCVCFDSIAEEWNHALLGKRLQLQSLVRMLLIQLLRFSEFTANDSVATNDAEATTMPSESTGSERVNSDDLNLFQEFSRLVEEHYREHWHLIRYASELRVSETRLNKVCRQISNRSSKKLATDRVFQESRRLLVFTSYSVNSISEQLGFKDPAYFARAFKKHCGMTAACYRRENIL